MATEFGDLIAERMRVEHRTIAARWFERLVDLLPVDAREVFPTESLLDHVPMLIVEISGYLRQPNDDPIAANTATIAKAQELGALRHSQRASLHQVLREYQILDGVLVTFVLEEIERLADAPVPADCVRFVSRVNQAVAVLAQSTVETFVSLYMQTIAEQNDRLEQFTRMAAHEWRQPLGALQFGVSLLRRPDLDRARADRTMAAVERNVQHLIDLTHKLEAVARVRGAADNPVVQEVSASAVAHEAVRQVREMADVNHVTIDVADDLPTMTVDVGRLELVLVNLLSNAVKYSDPTKSDRRVAVAGGSDGHGWCRIEVRDNGVGISEGALATIFHQFTRAHTDRDDLAHVPGIGLGLAIAEDCVRAMGGRIEVRSVEHEGTTFVVALPLVTPGS